VYCSLRQRTECNNASDQHMPFLATTLLRWRWQVSLCLFCVCGGVHEWVCMIALNGERPGREVLWLQLLPQASTVELCVLLAN